MDSKNYMRLKYRAIASVSSEWSAEGAALNPGDQIDPTLVAAYSI